MGLRTFFCLLVYLTIQVAFSQERPSNPLYGNYQDLADSSIVQELSSTAFNMAFVNTDSAILYGEAALELATYIDSQPGTATSYNNLGIIYDIRGDYYNSLKYFKDALNIYRELEDNVEIGKSLSYCANVYQNLGDYEKSIETFREVLTIYQSAKDTVGVAYTYASLGGLFSLISSTDSSIFYHEKAIDIFQRKQIDFGLAHALLGYGEALFDDKRYNESFEQAQIALRLFEKEGVNRGMADACLLLGNISLKQQDHGAALQHFNKAYDLAEEVNSKHLISKSYKALAEYYDAVGSGLRSSEYYRKYITIKDSLVTDEQLRKLAALQDRENEIALLNQRDLLRETELANQTTVRNILIAAFLALFVLSAFLLREYSINNIKNKELKLKNKEINEKNAQILVEKDNADKAAAAKSKFMSTMSHEIRTPLNAVIGYSHLLLQEDPRPDQKEHLKVLSFSGEHLLMLVNDILDFSKFEAGKIKLEEVNFNLRDLLKAIKHIHEIKSEEKGLSLDFMVDKNVPSALMGDPIRLAQIINNLINNAIKFTEEGQVTLKVIPKRDSDNQVELEFEVIDTGIGIPIDRQDIIFKSFEQVDYSMSAKYGGAGLGLAISKRLIEQQGGQISVESEMGKGSVFRFSLIFKMSDDKLVETTKLEPRKDPKPLEGVKVLMAEDHKLNEMMCLKFLANWKIQADTAPNGLEAYKLAQSKDYDLILMDLQMPEMDGFEATKSIRKLDDQYFREIPIIALTASATQEIRDKSFDVGMTDFISKPINPNELYHKIERYTQKSEKIFL